MEHLSSHSPEFGRDEELIGGVGLSVGVIQEVARRQLIGSVVVAILVAAFAGLTAMRPTDNTAASPPAQKLAIIHKPTFATPPGRHMADAMELP